MVFPLERDALGGEISKDELFAVLNKIRNGELPSLD